MRNVLIASMVGVLLTASSPSTFAADEASPATVAPAITAVAALSLGTRTDLASTLQRAPRSFEPRRPAVLPALYAGSAFLQGYDAYSTLSALKRGGVEANPVMKGLTRNPAAFIGLKAGVTVMSIMAAERMWKSHNRVGAVATMAVSNVLMTLVATNNARVLGQLSK